MKKIIYAFLACMFSISLYAQDDEKDYSEAFQLIEVWLEAQKDFEQLPGLTAIVIDDQEVLWKGAFGMANPEQNIAAQTTTVGSICSISKLFTAVAIMTLYDEGKLRLDDRIEDLLPWYNLEQQYSESGPITIRSLLTHSSGLPREANYPYWTGPDFPFPQNTEVREGLGQQETLYPASTYFQYSNLGLTLLGEIVAEVSGMPYEEYVQQKILEPLGLKDTRTEMPEDLYGQELAVGYSAMTRAGKREKVNLFQANGITAAAGFSSNVEDLGQFAAWQFRLLDSNVTEILKPSTLRAMHQVHWTDPNWETTWGLGFAVYKGGDGNTWVSHGGSCPGYRSALQINPKNKRALSVMINASGTNPGKYSRGINGILNKVKTGKPVEMASRSGDAPNLSEYVGHYSPLPWWSEVYIGTWEGKIVELSLPVENPANSMTFYEHVEGDTFQRVRSNGEPGELLIFERDAAGKVVRFSNHNNYNVRID